MVTFALRNFYCTRCSIVIVYRITVSPIGA